MKNFKWTNKFAAAFLCLSLLGCSTAEEEEEARRQTEVQVEKAHEEKMTPHVIEAISPLKELDENAVKLNLPARQGEIKAEPPLTYRLADVLKKRSKTPEVFDEKVPLSLQLANESLENAIKMFDESLEFEYIIDPGVKGTVRADINLKENNSISRYNAWKLFEEVLYMGGAYATLEPSGIIRISPFIKMPKEKRLLIKGDPKGNAVVELIELVRNPAADILNNIRPFMTDGASATILTRSNAILIVETPANMEKLHSLIKMLDNKGQTGWPQMAYQCKEIDSATILAELQVLVPTLGFTLTQGNNADPSGIKVGSIDRISVLVMSAPTQEVLSELKRWIEILDTADAGEQEKVYTYPVKHGVSTDLVEAIVTFFPNTTAGGGSTNSNSRGSTGGTGNRSTSSRAGGGNSLGGGIRAQQLNRTPSAQQRTPTTQQRTGSNVRRPTTGSGVRSTGTGEEPLTIFDMPVTVFEDTRRNQLMIRTTPRTYSMLQAILNHLDAPPMQVLIQITAVEVNLNNNLQYGFEYAAQQQYSNNTGSVGIGNSIVGPATFTPAGSVSPGISLLLAKAGVDNEFAFAQLVAGDTNTKMLFCPQILTMNGQEALINVGQEVPVRLGSSTTDGTVQDNIEYRDTGTILRVTPQISADKRVTLEVEVELSSLSADTVAGIDSPIINENLVQNRLIVNNKETILLGGIITKEDSQTSNGVPFLKDIPYLGILFGGNTDNQSKKELVIFVKATVVESRSDYENMIKRYKEALKFKKKSPELD